MSRDVHCKGCAYLVVIKGKGKKVSVNCIATLKFIDSPLRKRVDFEGLKLAMMRNKNRKCTLKCRFSIRAMVIKSWLMKNLGGKDAIKFVGLKEVNTDKEETNSSKEKGRQQKVISKEKDITDENTINESPEKETSKESGQEEAKSEIKTGV